MRQEQRLVRGVALSQQMRQSLDILRMDAGRLRRRLRLEAARNPCLVLTEVPDDPTPRQRLLGQVGLLRLPVADTDLARALVHCLDDHGWLADPLAEIAGWLQVPPQRIEALLPRLQGLDPPGVFARDLAESLRLQLQARGRYDPVIARLLGRLDLAASGDIGAIAAHCDCDLEDAEDMLADLRALSPHPLAGHTPLPPAELELTPGGTLRPAAGLSVALREAAGDDQGRAAAQSLIAAVQGRARTLMRVAQLMVAAQGAWLRGTGALRPLTLTALAAELGLDKSTVSRAIAGTAMRTPRGTVPLRDLLLVPVNARNPGLDRGAALARLRRLLVRWPKDQPISDARLAEVMARDGLALSRRTVAKYRAELGLPGRGKGRT